MLTDRHTNRPAIHCLTNPVIQHSPDIYEICVLHNLSSSSLQENENSCFVPFQNKTGQHSLHMYVIISSFDRMLVYCDRRSMTQAQGVKSTSFGKFRKSKRQHKAHIRVFPVSHEKLRKQPSGKMAVDIRLACSRAQRNQTTNEEPDNLVSPGDVITTDTGFMR